MTECLVFRGLETGGSNKTPDVWILSHPGHDHMKLHHLLPFDRTNDKPGVVYRAFCFKGTLKMWPNWIRPVSLLSELVCTS